MDIAGELLTIHRCLRSPAFRTGEPVRNGSGRLGRVVSARLSISGDGVGNEFEIRWEDGQISWIDGRLLTSAGGDPLCALNSTTA